MVELGVLCLIPVAAGLTLGRFAGGRLSVLGGQFRALWLPWLAVSVQAVQYHVEAFRHIVQEELHIPVLILIISIGVCWLLINIRHWKWAARSAASLILAGAVLNGVAIAANDRMPYSPEAAAQSGLSPNATSAKNQPADEQTTVPKLGDILPVPVLQKIVSIGDLLIGFGTAALLVLLMRPEDRAVPPMKSLKGGEE
jgi:hypothetical protein